jgi:hypothetical protein
MLSICVFLLFLGKKSPKKSSGRPTKRTRGLKKKVKRLFNSNSGRVVSKMLGISRRTVQRTAKEMNLKVLN